MDRDRVGEVMETQLKFNYFIFFEKFLFFFCRRCRRRYRFENIKEQNKKKSVVVVTLTIPNKFNLKKIFFLT